MSKKNLLDTLIYLFEQLSQDKGVSANQPTFTTPDEIESNLLEAGYNKKEVNQLLDWLELFHTKMQDKQLSSRLDQSTGFRIFHPKELQKIDPLALNYLLQLEQRGTIKPHIREFILNQIIMLEAPYVSLEHVKWILSMVKLNHEGSDQMLEMLIQDVIDSRDYQKSTTVLH